jgi:hypothetical protein
MRRPTETRKTTSLRVGWFFRSLGGGMCLDAGRLVASYNRISQQSRAVRASRGRFIHVVSSGVALTAFRQHQARIEGRVMQRFELGVGDGSMWGRQGQIRRRIGQTLARAERPWQTDNNGGPCAIAQGTTILVP